MLLFNKHFHKTSSLPAIAAIAAAFLVAQTGLAFALDIQGTGGASGGTAASTLGDMFFQSCGNTLPIAQIFAYVSYVSAAACTVAGIHYFRLHTDNQANNSIQKPLMLWCGAALLFVLPSVLSAVATSLGYAVSPTMAGCHPAGSAGSDSAGGTGLDTMMANFVNNIAPPLTALVQVIANVAGVFMMLRGLMKASKYGFDPRANSIHSILVNIGFGAILFTIGGNFSMVMASLFGSSSVTDPSASSVLSWGFVSQLGGGSQQFATAVAAGLTFVQVIGFIAFVRGWLIMKKVVEGGGGNVTLAQGITHIAGGAMAINIFMMLKIFDKTFGTGLIQ
ncbi:MAG: hypothetical protein P4M15_13320 [Alphaproteobacteria bacterium]|nr:hypothetical protein [Alphaproteobacteria bacterium]